MLAATTWKFRLMEKLKKSESMNQNIIQKWKTLMMKKMKQNILMKKKILVVIQKTSLSKTTESYKNEKVKSTNYGKIATAIGHIKLKGIVMAPPDINESKFTYSFRI